MHASTCLVWAARPLPCNRSNPKFRLPRASGSPSTVSGYLTRARDESIVEVQIQRLRGLQGDLALEIARLTEEGAWSRLRQRRRGRLSSLGSSRLAGDLKPNSATGLCQQKVCLTESPCLQESRAANKTSNRHPSQMSWRMGLMATSLTKTCPG